MISDELLNRINEAYRLLEARQREVLCELSRRMGGVASGGYNGHYHQNAEGFWIRDAYPIPVVTVPGLCDMEIQFDRISVTTRLKREAALAYSFDKLLGYDFEAYGAADYLSDNYYTGQSVEALKANIRNSDETEIGFGFSFPFETAVQELAAFAEMLRREGFYYES